MRNLLGWLETRLARNALNYIIIHNDTYLTYVCIYIYIYKETSHVCIYIYIYIILIVLMIIIVV